MTDSNTKSKFAMNGNNLFVDTNILIYFLEGREEVAETLAAKDLYTSVICEIEPLSHKKLTVDNYNTATKFLAFLNISGLTPAIKEFTIQLRRKYKIKLPDAIIAASAISLNIPFLTADKDFSPIKELNTVIIEL